MLFAIEFDCQPCFSTVEVHDERTYGFLTAKFDFSLAAAQMAP